MKNEKQIRQWAKTHTVHENDVHAIMGYLTALNIDIEDDINFNIGAKKECFNDFVEWSENDTIEDMKEIFDNFQKKVINEMHARLDMNFCNFLTKQQIGDEKRATELYDKIIKNDIPTPEYKPKVGDWVRFKDNYELFCPTDSSNRCTVEKGKIVQVQRFWGAYTFDFKNETYVFSSKSVEPAIPRKGEFWFYPNNGWYANAITDGNYVVNLNDNFTLKTDRHDTYIEFYKNNQRPCTEQEKQQLIKAVEENYNKTFNGKEWVCMKPVFKEGDYVLQNKYIRIYLGNNNYINYRGEIQFNCSNIDRYASIVEVELFDISLNYNGKRFNKQTLELEDILKVGDMVIAWNNGEKEYALVGMISNIHTTHYHVCGTDFNRAIKFTSEEQYKNFIKEK